MIKNIPEKQGYYVTGFADGEGSFNVSFRKRNDYIVGWKITPVFNISQNEREILAWIKHILKCGTIRFRKDGVWAFEVTNKQALNERIIPFFNRFCFRSKKKRLQFKKFKEICQILNNNSVNLNTIEKIIILRDESNPQVSKRRYSNTFILQRAEFYWKKNKHNI